MPTTARRTSARGLLISLFANAAAPEELLDGALDVAAAVVLGGGVTVFISVLVLVSVGVTIVSFLAIPVPVPVTIAPPAAPAPAAVVVASGEPVRFIRADE